MKRSKMMMSILVLLLALFCTFAGGAQAAKEETAQFLGTETVNAECYALKRWTVWQHWYYVPASLPENVRAAENQEEVKLVAGKNDVTPEIMAADLISGDDFLSDAVKFHRDEEGKVKIYVDNACLNQPGEAVFRIRLKAKDFYYETEYTLRVFDCFRITQQGI